jgi:regulator of sigma E protease
VDLLQSLLSNLWSVLLIVIFFGGSIFVHELGHFIAARRRGVHVERFSIGFGPKIFSWRGKDGVEYRLSWLPLGGYVALPQLADMRGIEGESTGDLKRLPPPNYTTKMIVFGAGALCNVLFAFVLACILWGVGVPTSSDLATTRLGYIVEKVQLPDGTSVTSPAVEAGLRVGDTVRAIDHHTVKNWQELMQTLMTSAGWTADGRREALFTIERDGKLLDIPVYPRLSGDEKNRKVGIAAAYELIVHEIEPKSPAALAGFQVQDRLVSLDGVPILNIQTYADHLEHNAAREVKALVKRGDATVTLTIPARASAKDPANLGVALMTDSSLDYPTPFQQLADHASMTYRTFLSLINPRSDIGISKLSGPVGIVRVFHLVSQTDIRLVLWFTILVNVNLAIFNLLPIPVLDGGHMLFATISKLRGRALPADFIATTQSVFMVLLFSMVLYVSFFDVRRWSRDVKAERAETAAPAAPVADPAKP